MNQTNLIIDLYDAFSTESAPSAATIRPPRRSLPPGIEPNNFPGDLHVLPLELIWMILDEILKSSLRLSHRAFCTLRKLALTNKAALSHVNLYLNRKVESCYIQSQLESILFSHPVLHRTVYIDQDEVTPIDGVPGIEPDILTGTILDGCVECFEWLLPRLNHVDLEGYNENGWSFLAIAAHGRSFPIFKYMLAHLNRNNNGEMYSVLRNRANASCISPQIIGILAQRCDLRFFENLFKFIGPLPSRRARWPALDRSLSSSDKYRLCTFATPALAEIFAKFRVHLDMIWPDFRNGGATSYHAAVSNGPVFLDYVHRRSEFPIDTPDDQGETPLHYAVRANRVDSVRWLKSHGGAPDLHTTRSIKTATHLAARLTSDESAEILYELLTAFDARRLSSYSVGTLLCNLVDGARETLLSFAVRSDVDYEAFVAIGKHQENLAMTKCDIILQVSGFRHVSEQTEGSTSTPLSWS